MSHQPDIFRQERDAIQDHCGIVAAFCAEDIAFFLTGLAGLSQLQTRGYDGAGIYCVDQLGKGSQLKKEGLIKDIFDAEIVQSLKEVKASIWLYQTRY